MKRNAVDFFIGGHFLWSIFRVSLAKFGKNPSHPEKFAWSYIYASNIWNAKPFVSWWSADKNLAF